MSNTRSDENKQEIPIMQRYYKFILKNKYPIEILAEYNNVFTIFRQKSLSEDWKPTREWVDSWKAKLPLQIVMRVLQVLVPQVEKMCIDKGLNDESEILRFLQHGTLVSLP